MSEAVATQAAETVTRDVDKEISTAAAPAATATRKYLRGSGLLLGGRFIAILLNLAVQVLTVRYLSKGDFGAFAYGLGIASIGSSLILVGLGKALPRFVPIYQEHGDYARSFGAIALAFATVGGLGLSLMLFVFAARGVISETMGVDPLAVLLLLVLIALAPLNAFDHLLQNLVAVFASARSIFLRRHVVGPALKLAAIGLVVVLSGGVYLLAFGYVIGAVIGVLLYVSILIRVWRKQGLLRHLHLSRLKFPARELFSFSIPTLSAELPVLVRGSVAIVLLEYFQNTMAVAEYRAVYPIAALNLIVFQSFGFLFVPLASRMFARNDKEGINNVFWQTATWITVLTFPVFAVTCSLAKPLTTLLFGAAYQDAGVVLAVLAVGYYFNAALGFNADTLRVYGKVRHTVASDFIAVLAFLLSAIVLIPRFGALGAAISTTLASIVHNIANHLALWMSGTGIRLLEWRFVEVYVLATVIMIGLLILESLVTLPIYVGLAMAALASLLLIRLTRHLVNPSETFPELLRIPLLRRVIA